MVFLQAGIPRSGNLWVYRTIRGLFDVTRTPFHSYVAKYRDFITMSSVHDIDQTFNHDVVQFLDEGIFWDPSHKSTLHIHNFSAYLSENSHLWTHSHFVNAHLDQYKQIDRIVYIIRDPRDVLISNSRYMFSEKMQTYRPTPHGNTAEEFLQNRHFALVHNWSKHVLSYLKHKDELPIYFVFYERLLANFDKELRALAKFLGFDPPASQRREIKKMVSFEVMHAEKPEHARAGQAGQWGTILTEEQLHNIHLVSKPVLEFFGYPLTNQGTRSTQPGMPDGPLSVAEIIAMENEVNAQRIRLNQSAKQGNTITSKQGVGL
ncbi:MAG: sulfotransferase domain-containing protein [Anaerolineae bacterium]|nr:sulfotransferase domain-containing protein [Anaerolineae bacterium]